MARSPRTGWRSAGARQRPRTGRRHASSRWRDVGTHPRARPLPVEAPATITVGSGAVLWDVRDFVAGYGYRLPVYNGGWAGPSVGGFVCAGGMGLRVPPEERAGYDVPSPGAAPDPAPVSISERHGGFWAHVARITFIDGCGRVHEVAAGDADFRWLFASMGQLGLILEVTLCLLPEPGAAGGLPTGGGRIPVSNPVDPGETDSLPPAGGIDWRYWFSALVPVEEENAAWDLIGAWCRTHSGALRPVGGWVGPRAGHATPIGFRYLVRRKAPPPPLAVSARRGLRPDGGHGAVRRGRDRRSGGAPRAGRAHVRRRRSRPRLVPLPAGGEPDPVARLRALLGP